MTYTLLAPTKEPTPDESSTANSILASSAAASDVKAPESLIYAASTRAFISRTLEILDISYRHLLAAEMALSHELYHQLKEAELKERGEAIRKEKEQGWGGSWGRWAATAGGVTVRIHCPRSNLYHCP